jgi:hypothetical protein
MATLVLTAVGTAIGGPIGGALGAFLGQQADRTLFGPPGREGPRLKELAVTTSSYGQPVPRLFGRMRTAGTIVWATDLTENSERQGGGKSGPSTTTYSYSASFAVALSSTPVERIGRIWADGTLLRGANEDLKVAGALRIYLGRGDDPVDPLIAADKAAHTPAFRDYAYVVFENLELSDFGNRIPALTFEVIASESSAIDLGALVPQARNTIPVLGEARGFADEGGAVLGALSNLERVFPLRCTVNENGLTLSGSERPGEPIAILPEQLSDRESENAGRRHRVRSDAAAPQPIAIRYYDEDRDYQPGVQRALGMRSSGRESIVDLPAAMQAEGARRLANDNAQRTRFRRERMSWRIGEIDQRFAPGAQVQVPGRRGVWRIMSWEWFDRGLELELDRIAPGLPPTGTADAGTALPPRDLVSGETLIVAFELPNDGSANANTPLLYAAASSPAAGWRGASLYVVRGETLEPVGVTGVRRAVIGTLASPLPASTGLFFEAAAILQVRCAAQDLGFESTDATGLAMGANRLWVDGEVVQFLNAIAVEPGLWELRGLVRAQAGTEDLASNGHPAGAKVVLLDDRLTRLDDVRVPAIAGTRVAAIGQVDPQPVDVELEQIGRSRQPLVPVAPRKRLLSSGGVEWCWTRRARGHWHWLDGADVPLVEQNEEYLVGFGDTGRPVVSWRLAEARIELSEDERSSLTAQHGPGALWVMQIGTYGRSSPLLLEYLD